MPGSERLLELSDRTVHLWEGGAGPALVYLHGADGPRGWLPFLERLSDRFTIYAITQPGFRSSTGLDLIDNMEDVVFHYLDVFEALGLERPHLFGSSMGAWIAAEIAVRHSDRLGRLALANAAGLWIPENPIFNIFTASARRLRERVFVDPSSKLAFSLFPDRPATEADLEEVLKGRASVAKLAWNPYMHDTKLRERLRRIKNPTLVIWGDSDRLVEPVYGELYAREIPGARLVVLPQTGHLPQFERPEELAQLVGDFFAA
ncbi:MAG: alpha/beta fold hydrolase [Chloroflexi bacterium]|nr:alpha/beta fold hydrolase [Chloroflexota bacterium]